MRRLLMVVAAAIVTAGFAFGEEPTQPNEQLKGFGSVHRNVEIRGTVALEESPLANKDNKVVCPNLLEMDSRQASRDG